MRSALMLGVLFILAAGPTTRAGDEADLKLDVRALEERFTVVKQRYDAGKRQYVLVLEARLTSDQACHFDASLRDPDDKEVRAVKVEFADGGGQTTKGERYTATVKYPTRQTMAKVTQIVIKKSD
jgi:hypothetical protein